MNDFLFIATVVMFFLVSGIYVPPHEVILQEACEANADLIIIGMARNESSTKAVAGWRWLFFQAKPLQLGLGRNSEFVKAVLDGRHGGDGMPGEGKKLRTAFECEAACTTGPSQFEAARDESKVQSRRLGEGLD